MVSAQVTVQSGQLDQWVMSSFQYDRRNHLESCYHPKELECFLQCCLDQCGHVACSFSSAWRSTAVDQDMWARTACSNWYLYREREIGHSCTQPGGFEVFIDQQCKVNHRGVLWPWWVWETVRGCCVEPCAHWYCAKNQLWNSIPGCPTQREDDRDVEPDWLQFGGPGRGGLVPTSYCVVTMWQPSF